MLVETLKWRNNKVLAIFTGKQYIFTNEYYGILAVAKLVVFSELAKLISNF